MAPCRCLLPDAVQDVAVGVDPQHDVLHGGVVDEGALGVHEEDVGHPDLLHQAGVERPALVGVGRERQPLVLPVVAQVQRHGEVLPEYVGTQMKLFSLTKIIQIELMFL